MTATTECRDKDPFTYLTSPDPQEIAFALGSQNRAPRHLVTLIAQQPFFKGLSEQHLQLLAWDVRTFTTVLETKCSGATLTVDGVPTRSRVIAR